MLPSASFSVVAMVILIILSWYFSQRNSSVIHDTHPWPARFSEGSRRFQKAYKHHLAWLPSVSPEWNFPLDCFAQGCAERRVGCSEGFCLSLSHCVAHEVNVCQLPRASTPNLPSGVERMLSSVALWICRALCESVLQPRALGTHWV